MGFMGIKNWVESDNAADFMDTLQRTITDLFHKELRNKANCYNTPGYVNALLIFKSYPDLVGLVHPDTLDMISMAIDADKLKLEISEEELEEQYEGSMTEFLYEKCQNTPLQGGSAYCEGDECSVGISPSTLLMKFGDRKISEIPQIVSEEIYKAFGVKINPKDVGYIEEASYNG